LRQRNQRWAASSHYVDNDLYVIGLPAPVSVEARRVTLATMRAALQMFAKVSPVDEGCLFDEEHNIDVLGLERVVFYMHGNLLAWAHFLAGFKDTRYFGFSELERPDQRPAIPEHDDISLAAFPEGMAVHVMRCSNVPVTFIRAQNPWAGDFVGSAVVNYQSGSSRIMQLAPDADEVVQAEALVKLAVSRVEAVWRVF
jgi:hypothetical protein